MTPRPFAPPAGMPESGLPGTDPSTAAAWSELWRTIWFDLPLLWADEIGRFLFGRVPPAGLDAGPVGGGDGVEMDQGGGAGALQDGIHGQDGRGSRAASPGGGTCPPRRTAPR